MLVDRSRSQKQFLSVHQGSLQCFMARGLKKHLKRLNAPKHWMLDKLGGAFAPKPSPSPHKSSRCLPLILIIKNRLKYALTYREVISILMQRHVLVDGKVRTDRTYSAGFMDVISIPKTGENYRLLYDTKCCFGLQSIKYDDIKYQFKRTSCHPTLYSTPPSPQHIISSKEPLVTLPSTQKRLSDPLPSTHQDAPCSADKEGYTEPSENRSQVLYNHIVQEVPAEQI